MELLKEEPKFVIHHQVTEDKVLRLEKGVRKVGFASGGRRIVLALFGLGVMTLLMKLLLGGIIGALAGIVSGFSFLAFLGCLFSVTNSWFAAKKNIHRQFQEQSDLSRTFWEYRFHDRCYEAIGENEMVRARYSNVTRLMDISGLLVMVERGNVVRYFMAGDAVLGNGGELGAFLTEKCGVSMERIRV